jgi:hypothetical protein
MNKAKPYGRSHVQDARMVMHEDEHAIVKVILSRALGDDDCFARVVSRDRSELGRAEDRLVLGRFLERMERQFALRAEAHGEHRERQATIAEGSEGHPHARRRPRRRMGVRG